MPSLREISVAIIGNKEGLSRAFRDAERDAEAFGNNVKGSVEKAENSMAGLKRETLGLGNVLAGFAGGFGAGVIQGGIGLLADGIRSLADAMIGGNAEFERYQIQLKTLLGSAEAAKQRLAELQKFADVTPFDLAEVVRASKLLQTFGGTALATGKSLTMVGDAASQAGVHFDELALWVGRFYAGLQGGRVDGEAIQRFRELAVVTPQFTKKLEELTKSHGKASEAWRIFAKDMEKNKGLMKEQGDSFEGLKSTAGDAIKTLAREMGTPFFDAAKKGLIAVIEWVASPDGQKAKAELKALAEQVGETLQEVGPKFIKGAGEGLVKFLKWVGSDEAKEAADTVKDLAIKMGELYVALKAIGTVKDVVSIISMIRGGAPIVGAGGMSLGGVGGLGGAAVAVPFGIALESNLNESKKRGKGTYWGASFPGLSGRDEDWGDQNNQYAGKGPLGVFRRAADESKDFAKNLVNAFSQVKQYAQDAGFHPPDLSGLQIKRNDGFAEKAKAINNGRDPLADVRLGGAPSSKKGRGGRSGGAGPQGVPWMEGMLDGWSGSIAKEAEAELKKFTDLVTDLERRTYAATGASEAQMTVWETQKGSLKDLTDEHKKSIIAMTEEAVAAEKRRQNAERFESGKQAQLKSLREYAHELKAESAIEDTLGKAENSRNLISLGYWSAVTKARLDDIKARKEANEAAKGTIESLQIELGLIKDSELRRVMKELTTGALKAADPITKAYIQWLAGQKDQRDQLVEITASQAAATQAATNAVAEAMRTVAEKTRPYREALNDIAIRNALVGTTSEEARIRIQAMANGMTEAQAAEVAALESKTRVLEDMRNLAGQAADGMAQTMLDSFGKIGQGFGEMSSTLVGGFRSMLAQMAADYLRSQIRNWLENILGGFIHGAGGTGHAVSGAASAAASGAASAIGAGSLRPGGMLVQNFNISTPDVGGIKRSQPQIQAMMLEGAIRAKQRNG